MRLLNDRSDFRVSHRQSELGSDALLWARVVQIDFVFTGLKNFDWPRDCVRFIHPIREKRTVRILVGSFDLSGHDGVSSRQLCVIKIGMTEKQIAGMLSQLMLDGGSEGNPFGPIVSSGPNAASPHAVPTDRPIQEGELMIIDWGAIVHDYPSDITRTFAIGDVSEDLINIYNIVKHANEAGIAQVSPGNSCSLIDEASRATIENGGYGEYFIHRTGHGLGLEVHEEPSMITGNMDKLVPGMTFTIEPGIYIPEKGGVRIEDDLLVTSNGHLVLTHFTKELIRIQ